MIRIAAYALAVGLTLGYLKGCTDERVRGAEFKAAVTALGQEQERRAAEVGARNKAFKEKVDAEHVKLRADYTLLAGRLRDARARSSLVPAAGPDARRPETIPFDRTELDRALRAYEAEVTGLLEEGDKARIDLDTVKRYYEITTGAGR
jgi:hypothetical protein